MFQNQIQKSFKYLNKNTKTDIQIIRMQLGVQNSQIYNTWNSLNNVLDSIKLWSEALSWLESKSVSWGLSICLSTGRELGDI